MAWYKGPALVDAISLPLDAAVQAGTQPRLSTKNLYQLAEIGIDDRYKVRDGTSGASQELHVTFDPLETRAAQTIRKGQANKAVRSHHYDHEIFPSYKPKRDWTSEDTLKWL